MIGRRKKQAYGRRRSGHMIAEYSYPATTPKIGYIFKDTKDVMGKSCECGICGHFSEEECFEKECECCINFHVRSGPKAIRV